MLIVSRSAHVAPLPYDVHSFMQRSRLCANLIAASYVTQACMCATSLCTYAKAYQHTFYRNARFCLICNYVNKIIPALQSRCTRFRFPPLPEEFVNTRVREICATEDVQVCSQLHCMCLQHIGTLTLRFVVLQVQAAMRA